ncbi:MAG: RNA methyltransferase [Leptospira sp.]|nr:RNA methyltransferase [Leptospira sp.]
MDNTSKITSFSNEKVKYVTKLKDKKFRDSENKFIIEGFREISKAASAKNLDFDSLFISPECFLGENNFALLDKFNLKTFELPRKIFEKISYRDRPDGLILIANTPAVQLDYDTKIKGETFLVIEGVEKPGNLGTILRTAEGAGISAVIVSDPKIDLFNPNVIRSSTGTLFTIPVFVAETEKLLEYFKKFKIRMIAVTPESQIPYYKCNLTGEVALFFGSEQYGLSNSARRHLTETVSIPMAGSADSLNLAMSCGIISFETFRQRTLKTI